MEFANRLSIEKGLKPYYDFFTSDGFRKTAEAGDLDVDYPHFERIKGFEAPYAAEGYRLPTIAEFFWMRSQWIAGKGAGKVEIEGASKSTHPVRSKEPFFFSGHPLYGLFGNVIRGIVEIGPLQSVGAHPTLRRRVN